MRQERTTAIGTAVERANREIAELGLEDTVCVVYGNWPPTAYLLGQTGVLDSETDENPDVACGVLMLRFTHKLRDLLTRSM